MNPLFGTPDKHCDQSVRPSCFRYGDTEIWTMSSSTYYLTVMRRPAVPLLVTDSNRWWRFVTDQTRTRCLPSWIPPRAGTPRGRLGSMRLRVLLLRLWSPLPTSTTITFARRAVDRQQVQPRLQSRDVLVGIVVFQSIHRFTPLLYMSTNQERE